jgi:hypothetical protein
LDAAPAPVLWRGGIITAGLLLISIGAASLLRAPRTVIDPPLRGDSPLGMG